MGAVTRVKEIGRRRTRRNKIRKLRARMARAKTSTERQALVAKLMKVSIFYPIQQLNEKGGVIKQQQPAA